MYVQNSDFAICCVNSYLLRQCNFYLFIMKSKIVTIFKALQVISVKQVGLEMYTCYQFTAISVVLNIVPSVLKHNKMEWNVLKTIQICVSQNSCIVLILLLSCAGNARVLSWFSKQDKLSFNKKSAIFLANSCRFIFGYCTLLFVNPVLDF